MYQLHEYDTSTAMNTALATAIGTDLQNAINLQGKASLALSGGPVTIELFQILSNIQLPWDKVYITLVDERWVNKDHEDSNERLIHTHLLQNKAKSALPLPIDVLVLGMGDDGHTASLFPHAANLSKGLDMHSHKIVIDMKPLTAPHDRISLTLPVIVGSRHLYLQLSGAKQEKIFQQALDGNDTNDMPIRAVLQQHPELEIYLTQ